MRRCRTKTVVVVGALFTSCLASGCRDEAPAPASPASARIAPAPNVTAASSAPAASSEADASADKPSAAEAAPAIACTTANDCWLDDDHEPIARPTKLRGKKIVPCKGPNSEHTPDCKQGKCVVVGWRC